MGGWILPSFVFCGRRRAFSWVITSSTPGTARAALSSMRTTRPLGIVLVTRTACTTPSTGCSAE